MLVLSSDFCTLCTDRLRFRLVRAEVSLSEWCSENARMRSRRDLRHGDMTFDIGVELPATSWKKVNGAAEELCLRPADVDRRDVFDCSESWTVQRRCKQKIVHTASTFPRINDVNQYLTKHEKVIFYAMREIPSRCQQYLTLNTLSHPSTRRHDLHPL